jgi:hypothetical protein
VERLPVRERRQPTLGERVLRAHPRGHLRPLDEIEPAVRVRGPYAVQRHSGVRGGRVCQWMGSLRVAHTRRPHQSRANAGSDQPVPKRRRAASDDFWLALHLGAGFRFRTRRNMGMTIGWLAEAAGVRSVLARLAKACERRERTSECPVLALLEERTEP